MQAHPRIAELASYNSNQHWLVILIALAGGLLIIGTLLWWLSHPQSFLIKKITIEGQYQTQPRDIKKVIAPYLNVGRFYLQLDKMEQAALSLPWIKNITIKLVHFNTLQLKIIEYQPIARWQQQYVDIAGELFELPQPLSNIIEFFGEKDCVADMITHYQHIQAIIQNMQLQLKKLNCLPRKAWMIHLDKGIQIHLGRGEIVPRLQRFIKVYHRILAQHASSLAGDLGLYIDLRYTNGIAVRVK